MYTYNRLFFTRAPIHDVPGARYLVPDTRYQVSVYQVPGIIVPSLIPRGNRLGLRYSLDGRVDEHLSVDVAYIHTLRQPRQVLARSRQPRRRQLVRLGEQPGTKTDVLSARTDTAIAVSLFQTKSMLHLDVSLVAYE